MPWIIAIFLFAIGTAGVVAIDWINAHGLAVKQGKDWGLEAVGMKGLFTYAGMFLVLGVAGGGIVGMLAGSKFWQMFRESADEKLEELRQQAQVELAKVQKDRLALHKERMELANQVNTARTEGSNDAWKKIEGTNYQNGRQALEAQEAQRVAEVRAGQLERRLKGAQGKAMRLARKKAQLTRGNAPKPA